MAKTQQQPKAEQQNGNIPLAAVPYLYNAEMLKHNAKMLEWQKAIWEGLRSIHEELEKMNKEK